ncbi:lycopene cyclase domain-containing protein [bacterium]|nr:lycopene cyclase domain-containing protein [bacterium]
MLAPYTYALLMFLTLLPVVLKARDVNLPLAKHRGSALAATLIVAVPFVVWDVFATAAGHWSFSSRFTTGLTLVNLPIEEVLFFIVVPLASILVWDTVGYLIKRR